jgi:hypothetical protein
MKNSRAECELLLACLRPEITSEARRQIEELLHRDLDWQLFLRLVKRHNVTPRLYSNLNNNFREAVPGMALEQLRGDCRASSFRALVMTAELLKLLKEFNAHSIQAIPFKGPTLAIQAYGDLALRQFCDLDLLIREPEFHQARALLVARGYQQHNELPAAQEASRQRLTGQLAMFGPDGIMVELHTAVLRRDFGFALDHASLWERLVTIDVLGRAVPVLAPEDSLLILCVHGAKHRWECLGWISDIAELIRSQPDLAWPRVLQQARQTDSLRMLCLGLYLAQHLLAAPLPPALQTLIARERHVGQLAAEIRAQLFTDVPRAPGFWDECRFALRVQTRTRKGLRYGLRMLLSPTMADWTWVTLPACLSCVYYIVRPVRLTLKYAGLFFARVLRRPG